MKWVITIAMTGILVLGLSGCGTPENDQGKSENTSGNQEQQTEMDGHSNDGSDKGQNNHEADEGQTKNGQNQPDNKAAEKPPVETLSHTFQQLLIQETNKNGRVQTFDSKSELIKKLTDVTTKELAQMYVNEYYHEKDGKLYLEAQDAPVWINTNQPYQTKKLSDQTYQVIQEAESELYGAYTLTVTFQLQDGQWKINKRNRTRKDVNDQGNNHANNEQELTRKEAQKLVRDHAGLTNKPNVKVEYDHMENDRYVIHVYDVVDHEQDSASHTATRNWYYVEPKTGGIQSMF
ncbi:hypothetical protein GCM10008983_11910 [Lentibacillus halophilus]|uniref:Lipoprotein n=1 Tax=Lentibacillus halophilus TaxID=295065 RepID=A0ABN0Z806_9BACI